MQRRNLAVVKAKCVMTSEIRDCRSRFETRAESRYFRPDSIKRLSFKPQEPENERAFTLSISNQHVNRERRTQSSCEERAANSRAERGLLNRCLPVSRGWPTKGAAQIKSGETISVVSFVGIAGDAGIESSSPMLHLQSTHLHTVASGLQQQPFFVVGFAEAGGFALQQLCSGSSLNRFTAT